MSAYVKVLNVDDLDPGQVKLVTVGDQRVAISNIGGTRYAIDDTCTHQGGPLSEGTLEGDVVTCPWHGARFCVRDGQVQGPPASQAVASYAVRVTNGSIEIESSENEGASAWGKDEGPWEG